MVFYRVYAFLINRFLRRSVYAPSLIPFRIAFVLFSDICRRAEGTRVLLGTPTLKAVGFVCLFVYVRMYYIIVPICLRMIRRRFELHEIGTATGVPGFKRWNS